MNCPAHLKPPFKLINDQIVDSTKKIAIPSFFFKSDKAHTDSQRVFAKYVEFVLNDYPRLLKLSLTKTGKGVTFE